MEFSTSAAIQSAYEDYVERGKVIPGWRGVGWRAQEFLATSAGKVRSYVKEPGKIGRGFGSLLRAAGASFMAYEAFVGYKQGGMPGAFRNYAQMQAIGYGAHMGFKALGLASFASMVPMIGFDVAVAGAAYYHRRTLLAPTVREHMRKRARLEMGAPLQDPYGNVATTRKRGLMAMRESKLNARGALGTEGTYRYRPYFR